LSGKKEKGLPIDLKRQNGPQDDGENVFTPGGDTGEWLDRKKKGSRNNRGKKNHNI